MNDCGMMYSTRNYCIWRRIDNSINVCIDIQYKLAKVCSSKFGTQEYTRQKTNDVALL